MKVTFRLNNNIWLKTKNQFYYLKLSEKDLLKVTDQTKL